FPMTDPMGLPENPSVVNDYHSRSYGMDQAINRISIAMITHNRRDEVLASLEHLTRLPERPTILVVDNASTDGTAESVAGRFPQVNFLPAGRVEQHGFPQRDQSFALLVLLLGL